MTDSALAAVVQETDAAPALAAQASGSSFYAGMRVLPRREREAMYRIYAFCRAVDDIADEAGLGRDDRRAGLHLWRADLDALYAGRDPGRAAPLAEPAAQFNLDKADFLTVIDGMEMDVEEDICAPPLAKLDLYCERVASAVGRLSVRVFGMDDGSGRALAHHLGRALQLTNILRDLDEDASMGRLYVARELLDAAGVAGRSPSAALEDPKLDGACRAMAEMARKHYREADAILAQRPAGHLAPPRLMSAIYANILDKTELAGWAAPRRRAKLGKPLLLWILISRGLFR